MQVTVTSRRSMKMKMNHDCDQRQSAIALALALCFNVNYDIRMHTATAATSAITKQRALCVVVEITIKKMKLQIEFCVLCYMHFGFRFCMFSTTQQSSLLHTKKIKTSMGHVQNTFKHITNIQIMITDAFKSHTTCKLHLATYERNILSTILAYALSYLIVSLHQKSLQNHKKSTIFNIFRIQKHIHAGYVNEKHPGPVHELSLCSFHMLDYFQNAKMMIFDDFFFGFFLVFVIFPKKLMIFFVSQH